MVSAASLMLSVVATGRDAKYYDAEADAVEKSQEMNEMHSHEAEPLESQSKGLWVESRS